MAAWSHAVLCLALLATSSEATSRFGRSLLQDPPKIYQGTPSSITVTAENPLINAITITPIIPYPQNAWFCNTTGDSRIPHQGPFPLTVYVPVGVTSTVVFANVTGPIPGTQCTGSNVVQQPGGPSASVVQQQSSPSSVVQQNQTPASVVQQQSTPASVVQQGTPASVVQQQPSSVVQQGTPSSVVQQQPSSTVVQQQGTPPTPNSNCVGNQSSIVQQQSPSVIQQPSGPATSVVQQSSSTVVQQPKPTPVAVMQNSAVAQSSASASGGGSASAFASASSKGRHLLQAGTIEYISNNGSTGQPQLNVVDTVEGVPSISFTPTAATQTATFNGALQVAITATHDGFGQPIIPYQVDSRLSPQCNVQVIFKAIPASSSSASG